MRERGDAALVDSHRALRSGGAGAGGARGDGRGVRQGRPQVGEATLTAAALRGRAHRGLPPRHLPRVVEHDGRAAARGWARRSGRSSAWASTCPGGRAAYPSTVLMTAVPARVAGVREIVLVSPPSPDGSVNPAVLAAARIAGVTEAYRVGGAQAIAALAYGTETIRRVDKIVGPGNIYVALAKSRVFGDVGIDMLAGPSEVVVIADADADPAFVAADLLAQAEHDPMARSVLLTPSAALLDAVEQEIGRQLAALPRREIAASALAANGASRAHREPRRGGGRGQPARARAPGARGGRAGGAARRGCAARARCSSGATRRRWWGTTWRARTTCCPPAVPRASPRALSTEDFVKRLSVIEYSTARPCRGAGRTSPSCPAWKGCEAHGEAAAIRIQGGDGMTERPAAPSPRSRGRPASSARPRRRRSSCSSTWTAPAPPRSRPPSRSSTTCWRPGPSTG